MIKKQSPLHKRERDRNHCDKAKKARTENRTCRRAPRRRRKATERRIGVYSHPINPSPRIIKLIRDIPIEADQTTLSTRSSGTQCIQRRRKRGRPRRRRYAAWRGSPVVQVRQLGQQHRETPRDAKASVKIRVQLQCFAVRGQRAGRTIARQCKCQQHGPR